jgi:hypothetical protein
VQPVVQAITGWNDFAASISSGFLPDSIDTVLWHDIFSVSGSERVFLVNHSRPFPSRQLCHRKSVLALRYPIGFYLSRSFVPYTLNYRWDHFLASGFYKAIEKIQGETFEPIAEKLVITASLPPVYTASLSFASRC